ncbi:25826_t:CDS:1, partial [Gigaspora margarita]
QLELDPWQYNSLSENDIIQLFYLSSDMNKELENELHCFINEIINNLNAEKYQETNEIDQLIEKQNNLTNKTKKCLKCFKSEIDNKK